MAWYVRTRVASLAAVPLLLASAGKKAHLTLDAAAHREPRDVRNPALFALIRRAVRLTPSRLVGVAMQAPGSRV